MYDVRDYGAAGVAKACHTLELQNLHFMWLHYPAGLKATIYDAPAGAVHDSVGIQRAIDAAHAAGGGTVVVPAGDYLISPLILRSRVNLHLEAGARLWGSPHLEDYRVPPGESLPPYPLNQGRNNDVRRLISAYQAQDIAITGLGQISAQSPQWIIPWMNSKPTELNIPRPHHTFLISCCQRVRMEGFSILNAPSWCLVFDSCHQVQVHGLCIRGFDVINGDGIDVVNTSNVTISDCDIWVTDDAICLKNFTPDQTMRNVVVTNCVIRTLCNGLKIGTETIGNFEDITFSNVVVYNPEDDLKGAEGGVNVCAMDGGFVRNVNVSNIVTRNVDCPFYLLAGKRRPKQEVYREPRAGRMERIYLSNIQSDGARYTSYIVGQPGEPIRDVHVSGVHVRKKADFYPAPLERPVPERPEQYPTPFTFGSREAGDQLPAYGLYMRHAERVVVKDFRVECLQRDGRVLSQQESCADVRIVDMD